MRKKTLKKLLIVIEAVVVLVAIWFGTVLLQKPPKYPFARTNLGNYFDNYIPNYSVNKKGLIKDVDAIVKYTDELHADPYRVISKEVFLKKAEEIKSEINSSAVEEFSAFDAFYYLQELVAFIKDGHTTLFPLNWEKTVKNIFPLTFTSIDRRLFVKKNYGKNSIPNRAEILSINGISVKQIRKDIEKYIPATLPEFKEVRFAERFALWIQTYYKMQSPWNITYRYNGITANASVDGIVKGSALQDFPLTGPYPDLEKDYIESEIEVEGKKVPVIEFVSFGDGEWENFKSYIDSFFTKNKDREYLIIDLRYNGGGNGDWGYYVLSWLTNDLKGFKEFSLK